MRILEEITRKKARIRYVEKQRGDVLHTFADISKAKRLLNCQPKVELREGLEKEVEWLKEKVTNSYQRFSVTASNGPDFIGT